jgi:iron complex outermembrane recepter protein
MHVRSRAAILLGTTILAGTTAGGIARAQTVASGANAETEIVIVTAEKRTEEAKNVPMSLTVLGQDELNKLNIRSFEDMASQIPGLAVTEADPSHPVLILRGINAGGDGSTVGTYLDETPYGSSNALANGVDTAPNLDTFDMQRVEVLRGPQGTLYGAGAEGGLIKFVTNAPSTSGFDDAFELGAISMAHGGLGDSLRGMFNVALTDDLAVRVVGFDVKTPGYINSSGTTLGGQNFDVKNANEEENFGGRISLLYKPTDKLSIRFNVLQQQLDDGDDATEDVVVVNGKITPLFGDYNQERTTLSPNGVRYYLYNSTIDWDFDFATLTSATSYTELHDYTFGDDSALLGSNVQGFLHQGKFIQEVRLASDPGEGPLDWLVGFYYANEHDGLHQDVVAEFKTPPSAESLNLQSTYIETTGFANATYHVFSNFEIGAGLRYATDSQNSAEGLTVPVVAPVAGGTSAHSILTWSADARYHLDEDTMFYGRVATGWRPGGPNDLPPGAPATVPHSFTPDSLIDYEAGVKSQMPDLNLSFDADAFDIEWRDIQLLELVDNFNINGNGGTANSKGFEANVTWQPVDRLVFDLNGAFTDAALSAPAPGVGGMKGNPLPNSPRWSGTLSGDYDFLPVDEFTPYVGASLHYIGIRGWGFSTNPLTGQAIPEGTLPDYATFDVRVGVSWDRWSVELYGKNINDAKGISAFAPFGGSLETAGLGPSGLPAATASIIEPRIFGIILRGKL